MKAFPDTPTTRHLFVVAASGPSGNTDVPGLLGADPQTVWQTLGTKLIKAGSPLTCSRRVLTSTIGKHSSSHDTESKGGRICEFWPTVL